MHLALAYGANRIWVVNVGDLKPMEFPIEFFLAYARTPERWSQKDLHQYAVDWATRDFGPAHAEALAHAVEEYTRLNSFRKPEMVDPATFSLINFHEADRVAARWEALIQSTDALATELPPDEQASFFELVKYPVDASGNLVLMNIAAGRNALDARQGNLRANAEKAEVERRFAYDAELTNDYNHKLLHGKWNHMMDQTHIGYTSWNEPPANAMPAVTELQASGPESPPAPLPQHRPSPAEVSGSQPPANFAGFAEHDNLIAIEAADTTPAAAQQTSPAAPQNGAQDSALHWVELPAYGQGRSAMTVFPANAPSQLDSSAALNYSIFLADANDLRLHLRLSPTLNFVPGRGLRLAVSVDDGPRQIVDTLARNTPEEWAVAAADNARQVELPLQVAGPGQHTLHLWAVDPAVVVERVVISHGPLPASYLGPPETLRSTPAF